MGPNRGMFSKINGPGPLKDTPIPVLNLDNFRTPTRASTSVCFDWQLGFNEITIKLLDSVCDSNKELKVIKVVPLVGASTTMLDREDKKFDIQFKRTKTN